MTASTLPERFARPGPAVEPARAPSGSPAQVEVSLLGELRGVQTVQTIHALNRSGAGLAAAFKAINAVIEGADSVTLTLQNAPDLAALAEQLAAYGFRLREITPPAMIDVAAIRRATGMTQETFARRFGLDLATLRKWEAGRSRPETAVRSYLALIGKDWEGVLRLRGA